MGARAASLGSEGAPSEVSLSRLRQTWLKDIPAAAEYTDGMATELGQRSEQTGTIAEAVGRLNRTSVGMVVIMAKVSAMAEVSIPASAVLAV